MNLYNISQKIDGISLAVTDAKNAIDLLRAADKNPEYKEIREFIVLRAVALADKIKATIATPDEKAEHVIMMRLMDAISDAEGLTPPQTKAELADAMLAKFKITGGVLDDEENDVRKDNPKADC